jgi:hypothetical protein
MSQVFHPSTNTIARITIYGAAFFVAALLWMEREINRSPYVTLAGVAREQPVPFSHSHHVGGIGIDCRYCHTSVEESRFAGIPPTRTCMHCHSQLFTDAPALEPIRESFRTGEPIGWTRVHDLPDFAYFDHRAHVGKGVGCVACHGRVDRMELTWSVASLQMEWCVECHRAPERHLQPRDTVTKIDWEPPADRAALGRRLAEEYEIRTRTDCSTCHR